MPLRSHLFNASQEQAVRPGDSFTTLSPHASRELFALANPLFYPANATVFEENDRTRGVFVVVDGEVKLSMNSPEGKRLSLKIARKGEILGLSSTLSGSPYEMTAETLHPSKIAPIERHVFLAFMARHPEVHQTLMRDLSHQYSLACDQLRTLALSTSAPERLARLLLHWSEFGQRSDRGVTIRFAMTHEEVGEFIGASRETVTRTLSTFKNEKLVTCNGSTLTIANTEALAVYAGF